MSHDIGIACRRSSELLSVDRLGHVELPQLIEASSGDHRRPSRFVPIRDLRALTASPRAGSVSLMARYQAEGEAAFEPRSRAPKSSPGATAPDTVELVLRLRTATRASPVSMPAPTPSPGTFNHHHRSTLSRATINRILTAGPGRLPRTRPSDLSPPTSASKPSMPNETWQSDFTHYRLTRPDGRPGADVEIITWLDDHSRYALHISAHHADHRPRSCCPPSAQAADLHGYPRIDPHR